MLLFGHSARTDQCEPPGHLLMLHNLSQASHRDTEAPTYLTEAIMDCRSAISAAGC